MSHDELSGAHSVGGTGRSFWTMTRSRGQRVLLARWLPLGGGSGHDPSQSLRIVRARRSGADGGNGCAPRAVRPLPGPVDSCLVVPTTIWSGRITSPAGRCRASRAQPRATRSPRPSRNERSGGVSSLRGESGHPFAPRGLILARSAAVASFFRGPPDADADYQSHQPAGHSKICQLSSGHAYALYCFAKWCGPFIPIARLQSVVKGE